MQRNKKFANFYDHVYNVSKMRGFLSIGAYYYYYIRLLQDKIFCFVKETIDR